jgi:hypothetical protein
MISSISQRHEISVDQPRRNRDELEYREVEALKVHALHPRDQILRAATDLSSDLLIISTRGYAGWKHFLLGSDAEKIVEHAPCQSLVVRYCGAKSMKNRPRTRPRPRTRLSESGSGHYLAFGALAPQ